MAKASGEKKPQARRAAASRPRPAPPVPPVPPAVLAEEGYSKVQSAVEQAKLAWEANPIKSGADACGADLVEDVSSGIQLRLPFTSEEAHILPNAFLRAALFKALETRAPRKFVRAERIFSVRGLHVSFTGEQFDQGDLDVLAGILDFGSRSDLGSTFRFSSYRLLKHIGKRTNGDQYRWLLASLVRLRGGTIEVRSDKRHFMGGFIEVGEGELDKDCELKEYAVRLNPRLGVLFGIDAWSQVDRKQRQALGRNGTAKALHAYYSSHVEPSAHRYETLAALAGLQNKQKADVKRKLIKAHEALQHPRCGFLANFDAGPDTLSVIKATQTSSQVRRLAKRAPPTVREILV